MKLNLGCQIHHFPGWTNVDIVGDDPNIQVEINAPAEKLPIENDSVDFIYAGHLVEHYYPDTLKLALAEWYRVLRPGGTLAILTPDCGAIMRDFASGQIGMEATWQQLYGRIYSYDRSEERHHIAFDYGTLFAETSRIFDPLKIRPFDLQHPPQELEPFMGEHISRGAYQVGVICQK